MLNYLWFGMLVIGFFIAILNGRVEAVNGAIINSAGEAVNLCLELAGIMCLWSGLMKVAEKSGLTRYIAKLARPVLRFLFPGVPEKHPALGAVVMNLSANFLGLGNAATPLGLKAIGELQKLNSRKEVATDAMCMFLVLNTSAIQLVPATVIAIRSACGSSNPSEIIGTVWIASACGAVSGIIFAKLFSRYIKGW